MTRPTLAVFSLALYFLAGQTQAGEINVLTDIGTPFPPGCIALDLPHEPASDENTLVDRFIDAPSVNSDFLDSEVHVTIWRVGCPDEGYSVVMVRLRHTAGDYAVLVPQVFVEAGSASGNRPAHQAQLIPRPAVGNIGASGDHLEIPRSGVTYMLAAEPLPLDEDDESAFWPEHYNGEFTLELSWEDYSPANNAYAQFEIDEFDPRLDPQQFAQPVFHGRHTGNYLVEGIPRTGLMIQVAEFKAPGRLAEDNFIFVIFFTYTDDGEQLWITGNTAAEEPGFGEIELEMWRPEGGLFFTNPPGSFEWDDVDMHREGTLKLRVVDCNTLEGDYDFREGGRAGTGTLQFTRMIRIAGYDCNPWED